MSRVMDFEKYLTVPCPLCGAELNKPCTSMGRFRHTLKTPHSERMINHHQIKGELTYPKSNNDCYLVIGSTQVTLVGCFIKDDIFTWALPVGRLLYWRSHAKKIGERIAFQWTDGEVMSWNSFLCCMLWECEREYVHSLFPIDGIEGDIPGVSDG